MISLEEIKDKKYEELKTILDKDLEEYKAAVSAIDSLEVLQNEEEPKVNKMYDEVNDYLTGAAYELPDGVDFDGSHYTKNDIARMVVYFLNKCEVEWSYTLGLWQLVKMWKNKDFTSIEYGAYDSTLRTLNTVKFKGFQEWNDILVVNEYFKLNHENYSHDTSYLVYVTQLHNVLLDRMTQLSQPAEQINE